MSKNSSSALSPRVGTYLVGIVNFVASFSAIFIVKAFKRKTLLVIGHLSMGVCHILVGIFDIYGIDIGVVIMINLFCVSYEVTTGPIAWLYASEVVVDSALGFCILCLWMTVLFLSLITNFLMDSWI